MAEVAICACDLAELLGSAVALNLLFGIPLVWGMIITTADVLLILYLQRHGFRVIEALVVGIIVVVGLCLGFEVVISNPDVAAMSKGLIPSREIVTNP